MSCYYAMILRFKVVVESNEENYSRGLKGVSHEILLPGLAGGGGVGMAVWVSFGQWVIDYCSFGKPST